MSQRDRNDEGRPQNARQRDAAGRPLPRGASGGVERAPEDVALPPAETITEAQRLLDGGFPFHAHEVLEAAWKAAEQPERDLWQGLAQLAVGLTHAQRGNAKGAVSLLRRGVERIEPYEPASPHGLDIPGLCEHATGLAERIEADGLDSVTGTDARPRLLASPGTASPGV
jgi:hypothetical protein